MNLGELKQWVNLLPEEFDSFEIVNGEVGVLDEQYHYRIDKPIVACTIDKSTKEVVFMRQSETELTESDIKGDGNTSEQV
jgi:alpha-acetolactate decarboxylase